MVLPINAASKKAWLWLANERLAIKSNRVSGCYILEIELPGATYNKVSECYILDIELPGATYDRVSRCYVKSNIIEFLSATGSRARQDASHFCKTHQILESNYLSIWQLITPKGCVYEKDAKLYIDSPSGL